MKPGEEVICIDDRKHPGVDYSMFKNWITEGVKYTIERFEYDLNGNRRVILKEISNPSIFFPALGGKVEPGFNSTRFANHIEYILGNLNNKEKTIKL